MLIYLLRRLYPPDERMERYKIAIKVIDTKIKMGVKKLVEVSNEKSILWQVFHGKAVMETLGREVFRKASILSVDRTKL